MFSLHTWISYKTFIGEKNYVCVHNVIEELMIKNHIPLAIENIIMKFITCNVCKTIQNLDKHCNCKYKDMLEQTIEK